MKTLLISTFLLISSLVLAQTTEVELLRSNLKVEKKAIVAEYLQLNENDANLFWPIYNKYEVERFELGSRRIKLIENYTLELSKQEHKEIDKLVKESATIQKKELDLRLKYYKIIKKAISMETAGRFYQAEDAINVAVRDQMNADMLKLGVSAQKQIVD